MNLLLQTIIVAILFFTFLSSIHAEQSINTAVQKPAKASAVSLRPIYDVSIEKNVQYGKALSHLSWNSQEAEEIDLLLDVYKPETADGKRPVIFLFHGGGFEEGSKEDEDIIKSGHFFASRGFIAIAPNYRLASHYGTLPEVMHTALQSWPEFMKKDRDAYFAMYPASRDAKTAVRWMYANAQQLNADTVAISSLGNSAGALISVVLGTTEAEQFRDEISPDHDRTLSNNHLEYPSKIHTIINHWGGPFALDMQRIFFGNYPYDHDDAPMQIVHGTIDTRVPFIEALRLAFNYYKNDIYYELNPLHWVGHDASHETVNKMSHDELAFEFIVRMQNLVLIDHSKKYLKNEKELLR